MVLGLLDQLLIFSQLYLIELLGLLTDLGLLKLWHLIYPRLLTGFGMLMVFFTNLSLAFGLISSFLSNSGIRVVLDGKSSQAYPVNVGALKVLFLLLHFSYYTLIIFLTMLSVILLSMLMILPSILYYSLLLYFLF